MAQLKEGSVIKKKTGDEVIATLDDISGKADKTELHNHTNKLTLDKFLETNGELHYNNKQLATIDNVVWGNIEGKPTITSGVSFYAGLSNEVIIPHSLSTTPTVVYAHPTTNPEGYLGEVWIRKDETNLYIGNSGQHTGSLEWVAILIGGH